MASSGNYTESSGLLEYAGSILVGKWDDNTRTYTDYRTNQSRAYTEAENAAADDRLSSVSQMSGILDRLERIERFLWPPDSSSEPTDAPTWEDYRGVWPAGNLLKDGGKIWRNITNVPLTTKPSDFPGAPSQWTHLFIEVVIEGEEEPEDPQNPTRQAWATNVAYAVGAEVTYQGRAYKCAQAHTSQEGWTPDSTPALWTDLGPI